MSRTNVLILNMFYCFFLLGWNINPQQQGIEEEKEESHSHNS